MTPAEKILRARIGGFALAAQRDPREYTRAARAALWARFEAEVDPGGILPEKERQRRAEAARSAHMAKIGLKSAQTRAKKRKQE